MKKIIRTNNLQKALEDYDALKGQTVTYVNALPVSPNIRSQIYGIEETHTSTKNVDWKISELLSGCSEEVSTDHYKIKDEFTVSYEEVEIKAVEIISDAAMLYEDEGFETALPVPFELNVNYEFAVATSTKEVAFYVGDASSQTLHPVVKFAEITALNDRIDEIVEGMDSPEVGGANKYIASIKQEDGAVSAVEGNIDNTVTENSANLITSGAVDSYVSGLGLTNDGLNVANLVATNATITDLNVTNIVANKLVADSGDVNSANIENLIANGVAINSGSANLNDVNIGNATINNLIANGVAGNDGQVLGKVNGNIEWVSTGIDTNDFKVNHLTVNNSASVNGNNFTHKGFDVTSMNVISEDDYNNLGVSERLSAFYLTGPNGNMYIHGMMFTPQGFASNNFVDNVILENIPSSITTHTLTFTSGSVTNSNASFRSLKATPLGDWVVSLGVNASGSTVTTNSPKFYLENVDSLYLNCGALTDSFIVNSSIITNFPESINPLEHLDGMNNTFRGCSKFNSPVNIPNHIRYIRGLFAGNNSFADEPNLGTFNQPLFIPKSVEDATDLLGNQTAFNRTITFEENSEIKFLNGALANCRNFNQPITIPNGVLSIDKMFSYCMKFNQPITIPNTVQSGERAFERTDSFSSVIEVSFENILFPSYMFSGCNGIINQSSIVFNNLVTEMNGTFSSCKTFNLPVVLPPGVKNTIQMFYGCSNFNQPVVVPGTINHTSLYSSKLNSVTGMFASCSNLNSPITLNNGLRDVAGMFSDCVNFNQPIIIPNTARNLFDTFTNCTNLNSPVTLPQEGAINLTRTFSRCSNFNQSVTIPPVVSGMVDMFYNCNTLNNSTVPIHISSSIALGNTSNYIYNMLVNGGCGITFSPSRILNDA